MVRDGEHNTVFRRVRERDGAVGRARRIDDVVSRTMLPFCVAVAALKDKNFLDPAVAVRRISAAWLHAYQHRPIAGGRVAARGREGKLLCGAARAIQL